MSEKLFNSKPQTPQRTASADARSSAPPLNGAPADLFSVALRQFAQSPPHHRRVSPSPRAARSAPDIGQGRNVECDSDDFVDSDEDEGRDATAPIGPTSESTSASSAASSSSSSSDASGSSSSSSSSDSAWGTFRGGEPQLAACHLDLTHDGKYTVDDVDDDDVLFVPDPIFDLNALQHKTAMPCLPADKIPVGATVWVTDEDDVATQLHCYFSAAYPPVCNGRLSGRVARHSGMMTLVCFNNEATDLQFCLCLPTSCLSLTPIEPYDSPQQHGESYGLGSGAYGMLGPRATGRGQAAATGATIVVSRYLYEAMPAYDAERLRGTALEKAQELFFQGSFEKALTSVNDFLASVQPSTNGSNKIHGSDRPSQYSERGDAGDGAAASASSSTIPPCACCSTMPSYATRVDGLILRSRILIFLERYAEALEDAHNSISLEPRWLRGYLSVARAHCGLGQFAEAVAATSHAYMMLPYSSEVERIKELNTYMSLLQSRLQTEQAGCYLILDGFYRKRLRMSEAIASNVRLCTEGTPIVATHSVFVARGQPQRCAVCFRMLSTSSGSDAASSMNANCVPATGVGSDATTPGTGSGASPGPGGDTKHALPLPPLMTYASPTTVVSPALSSPVGLEPDESTCYCSTECLQRASLYRPLEVKYSAALEHVRSLILSKGAVTLNVLPLEMASMTVRLFLMVVMTHHRLCAKRRLEDSNRRGAESTGSRGTAEKGGTASESETTSNVGSGKLQTSLNTSPSPPVYVETVLRRLGVYPLCMEPLKSNKLEELKIVYQVLTADFKAEDRDTFSCSLLAQLYSYVSAYFTPVDLNANAPHGADGRAPPHLTVYYLPHLVGCIEVAKTVSYTATSRRQDSPKRQEESADLLLSRVMERPSMGDDAVVHSKCAGDSAGNSGGESNNTSAMPVSGTVANCTVLTAPRPALLELVTVAPVSPECKLRGVPVSMALNSDLA